MLAMRLTKNSWVSGAHVDVDELVGHEVGHVREDAVAEVFEEGVLHGGAFEVEDRACEVVDEAGDGHLAVRADGVEAVDVDAAEDLLEALDGRERVEHARDEIAGLELVDNLEVWILLVPLAVEEDWSADGYGCSFPAGRARGWA